MFLKLNKDILKASRLRALMTQKDLSEVTGIHHARISKLESETLSVTPSTVIRLADGLGILPSDLSEVGKSLDGDPIELPPAAPTPDDEARDWVLGKKAAFFETTRDDEIRVWILATKAEFSNWLDEIETFIKERAGI